MSSPPVVAVDGPAGAGKSAVGRRVAAALGVPFIDSGLFYRAAALLALEAGIAADDEKRLAVIVSDPRLRISKERIHLGDRDLTDDVHRPEINRTLSTISQVAAVRDAINDRQRRLAAGGVVMAGRDIGTVVLPDTPYKFYLTAGLDERVRRRLAQKKRRGEHADATAMEQEISARDVADSTRLVAPLRPADDAVLIATDGLDLEQVVARILERVRG